MSDNDFFDSPREGGSTKKKDCSRYDASSKPPRATSNKSCDKASTDGRTVKRIPANGTDSDSDCKRNGMTDSVRRSVTKIPTGKTHGYDDHNSSSEDEKTERSSRINIGEHTSRSLSGSSRSSSGSSSGSSSRSSSRSTSRSTSSHSDRDSNKGSKRAWRVESQSKTQERAMRRPKSSHHQHRRRRSSSISNSSEERDNSSRSHSNGSKKSDVSLSLSESDSDMTDVSPLNSPNRGYTPRTSPKKTNTGASPPKGKSPQPPIHKDFETYATAKKKRAKPQKPLCEGYEHLLHDSKDPVNLKVLMHAILEMERNSEVLKSEEKCKAPHGKPILRSTPSQNSYSMSRKNYSFSNNRVKDIDNENQRLMSRIMKQSLRKKKTTDEQQRSSPRSRQTITSNSRRPSSAINRLRNQQKIDQENRAFLKRLEGTKATKTLQKDELKREMLTNTCGGVPLSVVLSLETRASARSGHKSPYEHGSRTSSAAGPRRPHTVAGFRSGASSVMSDSTCTSGGTAKSSRRPGASAKARPKSAMVSTAATTKSKQPPWEEGW